MPEVVINYQIPYTAQSLIDHIGTATPTTAVCWKLAPHPDSPLAASGISIRATSHDHKLVLPGHGSEAFLPGVAGAPTTIDTSSPAPLPEELKPEQVLGSFHMRLPQP